MINGLCWYGYDQDKWKPNRRDIARVRVFWPDSADPLSDVALPLTVSRVPSRLDLMT
jgi:hypothetical protein